MQEGALCGISRPTGNEQQGPPQLSIGGLPGCSLLIERDYMCSRVLHKEALGAPWGLKCDYMSSRAHCKEASGACQGAHRT